MKGGIEMDMGEIKHNINGVNFDGFPLTDEEVNNLLNSKFFEWNKKIEKINNPENNTWTVFRFKKGMQIESKESKSGFVTLDEDYILLMSYGFHLSFYFKDKIVAPLPDTDKLLKSSDF